MTLVRLNLLLDMDDQENKQTGLVFWRRMLAEMSCLDY